jgi:hypothetical protein
MLVGQKIGRQFQSQSHFSTAGLPAEMPLPAKGRTDELLPIDDRAGAVEQ